MTDEALDLQTLTLVRVAAAIASGHEARLRESVGAAVVAAVPAVWLEELILQSVLMAGYPRALSAMAVWRSLGEPAAPTADPETDAGDVTMWTLRGEALCRTVYGDNYDRLRENIRALHPALDEWMITEGYGRTLARPGLDLCRRELCIVAQTAVLDAQRQLHSHLRGALHAGATPAQIEATLQTLIPIVDRAHWSRIKERWRVVRET
jgi:4-carboxymuconolactone decarboxylase